MEIVREFKNITKDDVVIAGGKGASLGEMINAGIPVPNGFVVLSTAFDRFLDETDLNVEIDSILHKVKHDDINTVENASEQIKSLILNAEMPRDIAKEIKKSFKKLNTKFVAVRSSATAEDSSTAAWAGQLETYLNAKEDKLLENVKKCWVSLFTPRAIFYRFEKDLHKEKISVAVVIQKMIDSEASGVAFSVHPVTQDRNQLIIEAGLGLGEAIVSGQITPDSYVVEKQPRRIIDKNINIQAKGLFKNKKGGNEWKELGEKGKKQVLSDKEIIELSKLIIKIENHYGFPVDVEWAVENGKFYIVQSRPITTLMQDETEASSSHSSKQKLEKVFSRDFSLIALQMDYLPESSLTRPWAEGENPYKPYLIFWRNDGTSKIYFNSEGVEWIKKQLIKQVERDKEFLKKIERNVRDGIKYIRPIYEQKKTLGKKELIRFVNEFIEAYHWIEAMWWIKSMANEELKDFDCSNIVKLREETEELSAATDVVIRKSLAKLYPYLDNLSAMISINELRKNIEPDLEILKKRDKGFVLIDNKIVLDKTFQELLDEKNLLIEEEIVDPNTSILKGEKVSQGKYKGKVVRVIGHNDFEKVEEGDVLISPMTMIDFLPIMKIAGAFITDEGGALCHAAIVARELKKSCVVGTKVATQVLKDGDLVEVDADNGIVRILEKSREKIKLSKTFSREHSLFYCYVWSDGNIKVMDKLLGYNVKNILFLKEDRSNKISVWYEQKELDDIYKTVENRINTEKNYFERVKKEFYRLWKFLLPYIKGKKKIKNVKKLKEFYKNWALWWSPMAIIFVAVDLKNIPESIRKEALKIRTETQDFADAGDNIFLNFFTEKFSQYKETAYVVTPQEVFSTHKNKLDNKTINLIKRRLNGYALFNDKLLLPQDLQNELEKNGLVLEQIKTIDTKVIKGIPASKGFAKGKVRVVLYKKEINKVKKGEILVTEMTSPEFVPAMKRAGAIITDEGGLTSHAAIVARELKKPCIIGTKIATQVLKDGDLVEVDADKGIVRILERVK